MAKTDERSTRALAAAERLFKRKPDANTEEFRKACERADEEAISKLSNREFNGSYVLPLKRWGVRGKGTKKRRTTAKKARRRSGVHKKRGGRRALSPEQEVARLLRERDAALLAAADDTSKVYDIASRVEEFAAQIVAVATS